MSDAHFRKGLERIEGYNSDYLRIAADGVQHAGVVMGQRSRHGIGDWVKTIELLHALYSPDEMVNRIEFV